MSALNTQIPTNLSTEQAIVSFSKAKDVEPSNPVVYRGLGEAYIKLKAEGVAIKPGALEAAAAVYDQAS